MKGDDVERRVEALLTALIREQDRARQLEVKLDDAITSRDWAYGKLAEIKAREVRGDE